jgi:hypothetical protein
VAFGLGKRHQQGFVGPEDHLDKAAQERYKGRLGIFGGDAFLGQADVLAVA